jgi:hypothetical protein
MLKPSSLSPRSDWLSTKSASVPSSSKCRATGGEPLPNVVQRAYPPELKTAECLREVQIGVVGLSGELSYLTQPKQMTNQPREKAEKVSGGLRPTQRPRRKEKAPPNSWGTAADCSAVSTDGSRNMIAPSKQPEVSWCRCRTGHCSRTASSVARYHSLARVTATVIQMPVTVP